MAQDNRLQRKDLILITRNLDKKKNVVIRDNKIVLKINYYKTN